MEEAPIELLPHLETEHVERVSPALPLAFATPATHEDHAAEIDLDADLGDLTAISEAGDTIGLAATALPIQPPSLSQEVVDEPPPIPEAFASHAQQDPSTSADVARPVEDPSRP